MYVSIIRVLVVDAVELLLSKVSSLDNTRPRGKGEGGGRRLVKTEGRGHSSQLDTIRQLFRVTE